MNLEDIFEQMKITPELIQVHVAFGGREFFMSIQNLLEIIKLIDEEKYSDQNFEAYLQEREKK